MIRIRDIQNSLFNLVGWEQSVGQQRVAEYLTKSESGLYFQYAHPLITFDNLRSVSANFENEEYEHFDLTKHYTKGDVVSYNLKTYKALENSYGEEPSTSQKWCETDSFSEWLCAKTKASIQKAIMRFQSEKLANFAGKAICENRHLFTGTGRVCDTIKNKHNLVGFEINFARYRGVTMKINKIGLQFTKQGVYTIYIMHSSSYEPVYTLTLTKTKANTLEWIALDDVLLKFVSEHTDAGGSWYIVYSQDELPEGSEAIRKDKDWSKKPCPSCSAEDYETWVTLSKYVEVYPFFVNLELANDSDEIKMWDIQNNQYLYDTNFGLNLEMTVECDITDFIIEQRKIFQDVICKQLAVDMLREFVYNANVRTNRHSINASRQDIIVALDGDPAKMYKSGLSYELDTAFKAIDFSTRGISKACLPCKNNGIKYRTI